MPVKIKFIFIIVIAGFLISCNRKKTVVNEIEYSYFGMDDGGALHFRKDSIVLFWQLSNSINKKVIATDSNLWNKLISLCNSIDLDQVKGLASPSFSRAIDGASYASFKFTTNDSIYISSEFDGGNAPEELQELEDFIHDSIFLKYAYAPEKPVKYEFQQLSEAVFFLKKDTIIDEHYLKNLNRITKIFENDSITSFKLFSFTDTSGTEKENEELAQKRIDAVLNVIDKKRAVNNQIKYTAAMGEFSDIYDLHYPSAHAGRNCVDIVITAKYKITR